MATKSKTDFETSLTELARLVEKLEQGELPLDEALHTFEQGVALTRQCQGALKSARQKVEILRRQHGEPVTEAFSESAQTEPTPDESGPTG